MLKLVKSNNPILHQKAKKVSDTKAVKDIIADMIKALKSPEMNAVGLAAPQVGIPLQISVIEAKGGERSNGEKLLPIPLTILINPEIVECSKEKDISEEGCVSLKNIWGEVERFKKIKIKFLDKNGKKIKLTAEGLFARALQHEIDHLNGILFTERIKDISTLHKIGPNGEKIPIDLPKL